MTDTPTPASPDFDGALKAFCEWYERINSLYDECLSDKTYHAIYTAMQSNACRVEVVTPFKFNTQIRLLCKDGMEFSDAIQHVFPNGLKIVKENV